MASERELIALLSEVPEKHRQELRGFLAFSARNGRSEPSETEQELLVTLSQLYQRAAVTQ